MMILRTCVVGVLLAFGLAAPVRAADGPVTIDLWPGKAPGEDGKVGEEKVLDLKPGEKPVKKVTNVTKPTLTVYKAPKEKDTGASVVIAPGGGYFILAWDLEGEEVAQWLNSIGVTGIVLKYRVPRRPGEPNDQPPVGALQDAQRAISLVRSKAGEWGLDPKRIGMLGFSAGGHLTGWAMTNSDKPVYDAIDDVDHVSCRPDFAVLCYPAYLVNEAKTELKPDIRVNSKTPPAFFVHAGDDGVPVENSVLTYLALRKAGVPAELHVFAAGGHGFGLRPSDQPVSGWPKLCGDWMRNQGFLGKDAKAGEKPK